MVNYQYFFCCLMVNYLIIFLPSYHELSQYFFCHLIVNILETVVVVLWWINLIFYQMSHGELPCCLVAHLYLVFLIFYWTSHGEYFLYIFWCLTVNSVCLVACHMVNIVDVLSDFVPWQWRAGGGFGGCKPPPKFRRPSKIMPNSTRLWKLLKIAEFRMPTPQDVQKKKQ